MQNFLEYKYPGESYFLVDPVNGDYFTADYARNETILGVSGNTATIVGGVVTSITLDGTNAALVHEWDKTHSRLIVTGVSGSFSLDDFITTRGNSSDGSSVYTVAKIGRKVEYSYEAAHHFEDGGSTLQHTINPFGTAPDSEGLQYMVGQTGSTGAVVQWSDTVLQNYIVDKTNTHTITNSAYENRLNEEKRTVKILKKKYLTRVIDEFEKVLRG